MVDQDRIPCRSCRRPLPRSGSTCAGCGADQRLLLRPVERPLPRSARSAGIAVLLSVVWIGAGHLYAGRTDLAAALLAYHMVLLLVSVTGVGLILTVPMWLVSAPLVAVLAARAVVLDNRRLLAVSSR